MEETESDSIDEGSAAPTVQSGPTVPLTDFIGDREYCANLRRWSLFMCRGYLVQTMELLDGFILLVTRREVVQMRVLTNFFMCLRESTKVQLIYEITEFFH